jgi:hypothetical protein
MRELKEQIAIAVPHQTVWELLADFGGVCEWAPYMKTSHLIGDIQSVSHSTYSGRPTR